MEPFHPVVVDASQGGTVEIESDTLRLRALGAGQEVGRSCIYMEFKDKKILLDCGIHPGLNGMDALPFVDLIEPEEIDLLLISHFHLDHCGALPWFLQKTTFKGRCFMTHATKAIYRWLLADCIKVSNVSVDMMLYNEKDLEASMDKIETINFHEEKEINGIRFWCYNAGHVLGAAMFMIEIAGVKVLYTGDFSRQEDRHLMSAEIPAITPDILIIESTYGTHIHEKREEREARFTGIVYDTVTRGGKCLIPVFALGRAQELLLILDEYWSQHPELHEYPIYYASSLAKKCMSVYQTYINAMNNRIKRQIAINNPFVFKHISNLKSKEHLDLDEVGPCVVMATPGMMQSGLSRELFENWCTDRRNCCIIAGYCVEGTLAKQILSEPEEIVALSGQKLPRRCQIEYISFSAHTDYKQTSEFIRALRPPHIMLVHGEANEMNRLKLALVREYEDSENPPQFHNPKNTVTVELHFRGEKIAKVMGSLAMEPPKTGLRLSGILVKRNFSYHLLAPSDLNKYTDMTMSTISQRISVPFDGDFGQMLQAFSSFQTEPLSDCSVKVFDGQITASLNDKDKLVLLDWISSPENDMYADTLIATLLKSTISKQDQARLNHQMEQDDQEEMVKKFPARTLSAQAKELLFTNLLIDSLCEMFALEEDDFMVTVNKTHNVDEDGGGSDQDNEKTRNSKFLSFKVDNETDVEINITTKQITKCDSDHIRSMLVRLLSSSSVEQSHQL